MENELLTSKCKVDESKAPPKDPHNIGMLFFFLFGVSGWMAWNACLIGLDYYESKFSPDYNPSFTFGFVFNWPLMFFNFVFMYIAEKVPLTKYIYHAFAVIFVA